MDYTKFIDDIAKQTFIQTEDWDARDWKKFRKLFPELKSRLPCMWTRSYYAGTVGHVSEETVKKYIENQKNV